MIIDDEDLPQLIDGCFDDDDVLRTDLVKDVENNNTVTGNTNKNNDVDSGKRVKKRNCKNSMHR